MIDKVKKWYRSLPDKKVYFELLGAVLTIPVLVTVILLNLNNLNISNKKNDPAPTPQIIRIVEKTPIDNSVTTVPVNMGGSQRVSPQAACKKEIGPVTISSPQEDQVTNKNPVCITVSYKTGDYCGIEWAVKIDGNSYSEFDDKDVCYYNLSSGSKTVSVKVRSKEGGEELILQRNFQYGSGTATTSAALTQ